MPAPDQVGYCFHSICDLAVKIAMVLTKEEREELISHLLQAAAAGPTDEETLFLQGAINYTRSITDD